MPRRLCRRQKRHDEIIARLQRKKRQKIRIAGDLEDEITRSLNRNALVDDEEEEEEDQLAYTRHQILDQHRLEHDQRVYKASIGAYYDEGGSSGPSNVPQMRRSATLRENS